MIIYMTVWRASVFATTLFLVLGCASRVLEYDGADKVLKNDEFDQKVQVKPVDAPPQAGAAAPLPVTTSAMPAPVPAPEAKVEKRKKKSKVSKDKGKSETVDSKVHLPPLEDSVGFIGRRPIKDPFRIGEKVTLSISYFNIVAGNMDIEVRPMVEVNGIKAYQFAVSAKSNSFFNHIYGVDDQAITYVSYDQLLPLSLQITIKESKQLAETRTFFDWKSLKASYWKNRVTKEHGQESKKLEWEIENYSQNVISAVYYLRTFQFEVGKKLAFRVADEGKNIVFKGEILRKEKLKTDVGELDTLVMKPELTVDGVFTPVGDILLWLTDDERHFPVRIESKIKIGTLVAKLKSLEKGQE